MNLRHQTAAVARYAWTRVRRTWWLPAAVAGGLATGLLTATQTVAVTGMGVLQQAAQFLPLLQLGIMVLAALAIDPERDEDSAAVLWSWPVENAALVLGKFAALAPLAGLAALGAALPPAVLMAGRWAGTGLSPGYLLAEWGLLLLWLGTGAAWAAAVGGALGLWMRGLRLFAALLATWMAGLLGPYVFQGLVNPFFPVALLLQWSFAAALPADFNGFDLYALAGDVGLMVASRLGYGLAGLLVVVGLALGHRRWRARGLAPRRALGLAAGGLAALALACLGGAALLMYHRADLARDEILYYAAYPDPGPSPAPGTRPGGAPAGPDLVITRYELDVDARRPPTLAVNAVLTLKNRGTEPLARPALSLRHVFRVQAVEVEGRPARWTRRGDGLRLEELTLAPGEETRVRVEYAGPVDAWRLELGIPPVRIGIAALPWTWRGPYVARHGLYLPASYGWYPLAEPAPLAGVDRRPAGLDATGPGGLVLVEGPVTNYAAVIRRLRPEPLAPAPGQPEEDRSRPVVQPRAFFRVTVHRHGNFPVLSNLPRPGQPTAATVTMEGETAYLTLVGRPLAVARTAAGEVYYPPEDGRRRDRGLEWAGWLHQAYTWLGVEGITPRIVTYPAGQGIAETVVDPDTGVVVDPAPRSRSLIVPPQVFQAVLVGAREPSPAEACLVHALQAVAGPYGVHSRPARPAVPAEEELPGPCDGLRGGPTGEEVLGWLTGSPREEVRRSLAVLRATARQRPLAAQDLKEAMGR